MTTELTQRAIDYNFSRPFDVNRISDYPIVKDAITRIYEQVIANVEYSASALIRPSVLNKLKSTTTVLVLDLYLANKASPALWLGMNWNKNMFGKQSRYKAIHLGYRPFKAVFDAFNALDFIDVVKGHYYRDSSGRVGHVTRARATENFMQLVELPQPEQRYRYKRIQPLMINRHPEEEIIILRDENGTNIEYRDDDTSQQMRLNLQRINTLLDKTCLNLKITDKQYEQINVRMRQSREHPSHLNVDDCSLVVDLSRKRLKRVFNNSSFTEGGRFYGAFWQEIPKEYRAYIEINGSSIVELDYSGMHFAMLYAREAINLESDPYQLDGFSTEARVKLKRILNIMLNASNDTSAAKAMRNVVALDELPIQYQSYRDVIDAFKARHQGIEQYFCSGFGITLQYFDSTIAEAVMLHMMENDIPTLPVHDSFIVSYIHRDELITVMKDKYQQQVGRLPNTSQSQTVFDVTEVFNTISFEEQLKHNIAMIEGLQLRGNDEYTIFETYQTYWYELNSNVI